MTTVAERWQKEKGVFGSEDGVAIGLWSKTLLVQKATKKPGKKKTLIVNPATPNPVRTSALEHIQDEAEKVFESAGANIATRVARMYMDGEDADAVATALDFSEFVALTNQIIGSLASVAQDSANEQLAALGTSDNALFDLVDTDAVDYARDRAAELVGRKWVDGKLVDNPNPKWAITETTRDNIRALVNRAYTDGMTPVQLKKELIAAHDFSPARAQMIARTETTKSSIQGALGAWKRSGLVIGKRWLLSDDHDQDDECNLNADQGVIDLDDDFDTGDDGPPAHPSCLCSLVSTVDDGSGDEE